MLLPYNLLVNVIPATEEMISFTFAMTLALIDSQVRLLTALPVPI